MLVLVACQAHQGIEDHQDLQVRLVAMDLMEALEREDRPGFRVTRVALGF